MKGVKVVVSGIIPISLAERLDKYCKEKEISTSAFIRIAIQEKLEREGY